MICGPETKLYKSFTKFYENSLVILLQFCKVKIF